MRISVWSSDVCSSDLQITLRQLLSMTGGQASTVGRAQGYLDSVKAPLTAAPGSKFQYGPAPMQIFGEIMRRKLVAKGQAGNARHYVERSILTPLGVTISCWHSGPDGESILPQCLVMGASEGAKIGGV